MRVLGSLFATVLVLLLAAPAEAQRLRSSPRVLRIAATTSAGLGTLALTAGGQELLWDLAARDCPAAPARCVTRELSTLLGTGGLIMAGPGLTPFVVHRTGHLAGGNGNLWWTTLGSALGTSVGLVALRPRVLFDRGPPSAANLALVGFASLAGAVLAYELSSREDGPPRTRAPFVRLSPDFTLGQSGLVAGVSGEFP
jgi:hypothetical protein